LKEQLLLLIALQECDSQLVKMVGKKKDLPEKISKLDEDFRIFQEGIEQNKKKYDEIKTRHVESENKIKKINDGIVKTRERLLEVKNNKEYQAMLKENETAEAMRGDVETEIIKMLDEMDKLAVQVKKDAATLAEYRKQYEEEKKSLENELSSIDADYATWEQKRNDLIMKVSADLMARYEKIKHRNNGVGVISVWKAVCNGCHMNLPPQLYIEVQKSSELLFCPNCSRILYFQNMEKTD
jgi:predicted  nucleic acid-binding Zn-ribbon protein